MTMLCSPQAASSTGTTLDNTNKMNSMTNSNNSHALCNHCSLDVPRQMVQPLLGRNPRKSGIQTSFLTNRCCFPSERVEEPISAGPKQRRCSCREHDQSNRNPVGMFTRSLGNLGPQPLASICQQKSNHILQTIKQHPQSGFALVTTWQCGFVFPLWDHRKVVLSWGG